MAGGIELLNPARHVVGGGQGRLRSLVRLALSLVRPTVPRSLERLKNQPDDSRPGVGHSRQSA